MSAIYVCTNCRRWLFGRLLISNTPQCLPKANFVSHSKQQPVELPRKPSAGVLVRHTGGKNVRVEETAGETVSQADPLESIFVAQREVKKSGQAARSVVLPSQGVASHQSHLTELEQSIVNQQARISDSWQLFRRYYGTKESVGFKRPSTRDRVLLSRGTTFERLLRAIVATWARGERSLTPVEAVRLFTQLGIMRETYWHDTLWAMLGGVLEKNSGISVSRNPLDEGSRSRGAAILLEDTLDVWRAFFDSTIPERSRTGASDWPGLPDVKGLGIPTMKSYPTRFLQFFPNFESEGICRNISHAAALTFAILHPRDGGLFESVNVAGATPFSRFIAYLLSYSEAPYLVSSRYLRPLNFPIETYKEMIAEWDGLVTTASAILASDGAVKGTQTSPSTGGIGSQKDQEALFMRALSHALLGKDLKRTELIWRTVSKWYSDRGYVSSEIREPVEDGQGKVNQKIPVRLYNQFILVFMALGKHNRAVDIWNDMVLAGQQPTVESWHAFIDGCRKARDAQGIENVWERMLATGIQPDAWCWTTRIHGLIQSGKWEQGVGALQQMGMIWLEAAKSRNKGEGKKGKSIDKAEISTMGDIGDIIKPNTTTINATISALLRHRKVDAAERVLRWACSLGIPSDVVTFNTLLRPMIRTGDISAALALFKEMESLGIKPDVVTFTILIDGLFREPPTITTLPVPESEQSALVATVADLLNGMEAVGVPASVRSYSTLIDGLLNTHKNLAATRAVLAHMASRNVSPSTHIYTILLIHYFSQNPPDLPAVDSIWRCVVSDKSCSPDLVFYDKMIEGYAAAGNMNKMLYFLNRLPREGKAPSWFVLVKVVRALIEREEWACVAVVAGDVVKGEGVAQAGVRGWAGKEEFWELVRGVKERMGTERLTSNRVM
jgi:pentatricopeptide repeat protein